MRTARGRRHRPGRAAGDRGVGPVGPDAALPAEAQPAESPAEVVAGRGRAVPGVRRAGRRLGGRAGRSPRRGLAAVGGRPAEPPAPAEGPARVAEEGPPRRPDRRGGRPRDAAEGTVAEEPPPLPPRAGTAEVYLRVAQAGAVVGVHRRRDQVRRHGLCQVYMLAAFLQLRSAVTIRKWVAPRPSRSSLGGGPFSSLPAAPRSLVIGRQDLCPLLVHPPFDRRLCRRCRRRR